MGSSFAVILAKMILPPYIREEEVSKCGVVELLQSGDICCCSFQIQ